MMAQALLFDIFFEKDPHLNVVETFLSLNCKTLLSLTLAGRGLEILYLNFKGMCRGENSFNFLFLKRH